MSRGWYLMHRGWMESADFRKEAFSEPQAFLWSIEQAAFEPHRQWFNGTQYEVGRGEFVTSIRKMAAAFRWPEKRVRRWVARLELSQKWERKGAHQGAQAPTLLTVCNYDVFQSVPRGADTARGTETGTARAQQGHSKGTARAHNRKNY